MFVPLFSKLSVIVFIISSNYFCNFISYGCGHSIKKRIVEGVQCDVQQVPFAAFIFTAGAPNMICSGALITRNWILTAGHCVNVSSILRNDTKVVMGLNKPSDHNEDKQERLITYAAVYDRFPQDPWDHIETRYDIGLLYTSLPFQITKKVAIAKLPPTKDFTISCKTGTVAGWGSTEPKAPNIETLQKFSTLALNCANISLLFDLKTCVKQVNPSGWKAGESVFCLPVTKDGAGTCNGDSGAPVFCQSDILVGVVSSGVGCGQPGLFSFATRIDNYFTFIGNYTRLKLPFKSDPSSSQLILVGGTGVIRTGTANNSRRTLSGDGYCRMSVLVFLLLLLSTARYRLFLW